MYRVAATWILFLVWAAGLVLIGSANVVSSEDPFESLQTLRADRTIRVALLQRSTDHTLVLGSLVHGIALAGHPVQLDLYLSSNFAEYYVLDSIVTNEDLLASNSSIVNPFILNATEAVAEGAGSSPPPLKETSHKSTVVPYSRRFFAHQLSSLDPRNAEQYDVVVVSICEKDGKRLLRQSSPWPEAPIVVCFVHHGNFWGPQAMFSAIRPWLKARKLRILTMAPFTNFYWSNKVLPRFNSLEKRLQMPHMDYRTLANFSTHFVSALPWDFEADDVQGKPRVAVLPGGISKFRRNYGQMMQDLEAELPRLKNLTRDRDMSPSFLWLGRNVGHKQIPESLNDVLTTHGASRFTDFLGDVANSTAMMLYLADIKYLRTVGTDNQGNSITCNVPILASPHFLQRYSQFSENNTFPLLPGESEVSGFIRLLERPDADEIIAKTKRELHLLKQRLLKRNGEIFREIIAGGPFSEDTMRAK